MALLIDVPSGDLSGRCGVLVVACAAAGSVVALLPPRIGIRRCRGRPPCGPRAVGSANRRPARQAPPGGPPGWVPARSLSPGIFRASALACCGRPPSFPPGQPWRPEDPDSTIHVRKAVTMIAEDDPYRLVTCGSVVVAAGGRLRRSRVRSQAARRARLCGHGRHGGFRADRGGRPRLDAAQLTYRVDLGAGAGSASRGYRRMLMMRWSNELRTLPTCRGRWLCCRLVMTRPSARVCSVPVVGSCRSTSTSRSG